MVGPLLLLHRAGLHYWAYLARVWPLSPLLLHRRRRLHGGTPLTSSCVQCQVGPAQDLLLSSERAIEWPRIITAVRAWLRDGTFPAPIRIRLHRRGRPRGTRPARDLSPTAGVDAGRVKPLRLAPVPGARGWTMLRATRCADAERAPLPAESRRRPPVPRHGGRGSERRRPISADRIVIAGSGRTMTRSGRGAPAATFQRIGSAAVDVHVVRRGGPCGRRRRGRRGGGPGIRLEGRRSDGRRVGRSLDGRGWRRRGVVGLGARGRCLRTAAGPCIRGRGGGGGRGVLGDPVVRPAAHLHAQEVVAALEELSRGNPRCKYEKRKGV